MNSTLSPHFKSPLALSSIALAACLFLSGTTPANAADKPTDKKPTETLISYDMPAPKRTTTNSQNPELKITVWGSYNRTVTKDSIFFAKKAPPTNKSSFGRFIHRHLTKDEEFRFISESTKGKSRPKVLTGITAGYGAVINDDSVLTRGQNGTRRETPSYFFVRSSVDF